ncbi:MAG: ribosome biogenesis GTPase Der [Gammaproteobacteria bacterium]|nr:ribosome biogenesis GTPase Der [Gammaproteobacteria bacterium]
MKPVIALVGRPNVGKSTLFNRLTGTRDALVADQPGLTRDRKYGDVSYQERNFILIDTGGLSGEDEGIDVDMARQSWQAVEEADRVMFLVDGREGLSAADEAIGQRLRQSGKAVTVVVNKSEGLNPAMVSAEFHALGQGDPVAISAEHGHGIQRLITELLPEPNPEPDDDVDDESGIKVAIIGRPNVGKSTLVNRIMGEERVVVFDMPGTTRDSIFIPFERDGQRYTLIDTAGVRRRARIKEAIEKFSIIKSLQAIEAANVVIMVLDAQEGISDQDAHLLGFAMDQGRALVMAVNKWDNLEPNQKDKVKRELDLKLPFLGFAKVHFISALHGTGVGDLFGSVIRAYRSATRKFSTPDLTRTLEALVQQHQPPLVKGRRIKLRYAHQGGRNPPLIVIHGNQTSSIPDAYRRYLMNAFMKDLRLEGTPLRIEFKSGDNPFKGKVNKLSKRQQERKKRLVGFIKKKEKQKKRRQKRD